MGITAGVWIETIARARARTASGDHRGQTDRQTWLKTSYVAVTNVRIVQHHMLCVRHLFK